MQFYRQVRPWGFWGPVYEKVRQEDPGFRKNTSFGRDMFNVATGIVWQLGLIALPILFVVQDQPRLWGALGIVLLCSYVLKKNWYDKLEN